MVVYYLKTKQTSPTPKKPHRDQHFKFPSAPNLKPTTHTNPITSPIANNHTNQLTTTTATNHSATN